MKRTGIMDNTNDTKNTKIDKIRKNYRCLSGSALKTIAFVTMLIDHTASVLLANMKFAVTPMFTAAGTEITWYMILRTIGRIAFPIYCFLLVEGYMHTRDRKKYGMRLLIFAIISEIPWSLEHTGTLFSTTHNVFFTLFSGLCAIYVYDNFRSDRMKTAVLLIFIFVISMYAKCDYGIKGTGFILFLYLMRENSLIRALVGCCFFARPDTVIPAFAFIQLYNGKRGYIKGRVLQYLFYILYPAHMLLLYVLKLVWFGYK